MRPRRSPAPPPPPCHRRRNAATPANAAIAAQGEKLKDVKKVAKDAKKKEQAKKVKKGGPLDLAQMLGAAKIADPAEKFGKVAPKKKAPTKAGSKTK